MTTVSELARDVSGLTAVITELKQTFDLQVVRVAPLEQVLGARDEEIRRLKAEAKTRDEEIKKLKAAGVQCDHNKAENVNLRQLINTQDKLIGAQERVIATQERVISEGDDYR